MFVGYIADNDCINGLNRGARPCCLSFVSRSMLVVWKSVGWLGVRGRNVIRVAKSSLALERMRTLHFWRGRHVRSLANAGAVVVRWYRLKVVDCFAWICFLYIYRAGSSHLLLQAARQKPLAILSLAVPRCPVSVGCSGWSMLDPNGQCDEKS
jgi:hypothetical protein